MTLAYAEQAEAVRTTASSLAAWADSVLTAADRIGPITAWSGPAADTAADAVQDLRTRARAVAEVPDAAADALRRCSAELEHAAALQQRASALAGDDALRLQVEAAEVARAALCRAAASLQDLRPTLAGRGLRGQVAGFGRGAWDSVHGLWDLTQRFSPVRGVLHPVATARDLWAFDRGLVDAATHPVDTAESLAGVDQLRDGAYGEWLGGLVAGAVVPGGRAGRLEGLGSRALVRLVDRGGPVVVRVGVRVPRGYPAVIRDLSQKRRTHILDGDGPKKGGGHRAGTGKPGKTEFPPDWSDDDIIKRVMHVATRPESVRVQPRSPNLLAQAQYDGVTVSVVVSPDGHVLTAYPEPGGRGVVDNPRGRGR